MRIRLLSLFLTFVFFISPLFSSKLGYQEVNDNQYNDVKIGLEWEVKKHSFKCLLPFIDLEFLSGLVFDFLNTSDTNKLKKHLHFTLNKRLLTQISENDFLELFSSKTLFHRYLSNMFIITNYSNKYKIVNTLLFYLDHDIKKIPSIKLFSKAPLYIKIILKKLHVHCDNVRIELTTEPPLRSLKELKKITDFLESFFELRLENPSSSKEDSIEKIKKTRLSLHLNQSNGSKPFKHGYELSLLYSIESISESLEHGIYLLESDYKAFQHNRFTRGTVRSKDNDTIFEQRVLNKHPVLEAQRNFYYMNNPLAVQKDLEILLSDPKKVKTLVNASMISQNFSLLSHLLDKPLVFTELMKALKVPPYTYEKLLEDIVTHFLEEQTHTSRAKFLSILSNPNSLELIIGLDNHYAFLDETQKLAFENKMRKIKLNIHPTVIKQLSINPNKNGLISVILQNHSLQSKEIINSIKNLCIP